MNRKYLVGAITTGLVLTSAAGIVAGSFTDGKFKFKDTSNFRTDEKVQKIYNDVYNSLPEYAKVKVSLYDTEFTSNNVNDYSETDGFKLSVNAAGFASNSKKVVMIDGRSVTGNELDSNFQQTTKRVLYHEFGHAIDFKQDVDNIDDITKHFGASDSSRFLYSGTEKFKQIYQKEHDYMRDMYMIYMGSWSFKSKAEQEATYELFKAKDPNYIKERNVRYGTRFSYWEDSISEFWAESVSYYMEYPDELKSVAPETYAYIRNVLNQNYHVPQNLGYADVAYNLDYFAETNKIDELKQVMHTYAHTIANDDSLTAIVVAKLGEQGKAYIKSDDAANMSFDDYVKNGKGNNTDETKDAGKTDDKTADSTGGQNSAKENQSVYDADFANYYGWVQKDDKWYYVDENGKKAVGWYEEGGQKYYFNEDGSMKTGLVETEDGSKVYYDDFGNIKKTGWKQDGKDWYYLDENGTAKTGWVQDSGKWYYLNEKGTMATGWVKDGSAWYYLDSSGSMKTGWVQDGSKWYYLNDNGSMKTGWVQDGSKWYYLNTDGTMATNTTVDGYSIGSDGAWV